MKAFNPEKELYKIKYGKRDKIVLGIILLLVIVSISSTFALYQVRHTKRIIYTKVAPFNINKYDLDLAVYVDGQEQSNVPNKDDGYFYDGITCESDEKLSARWNYTEWGLEIFTILPNKCKINFTKSPLITEILKYINETKTIIMDDETSDHNLRYIGTDPYNYIWFNCKSYENLNNDNAEDEAHSCERWRIIGLMNNITLVNGYENTVNKKEENLVKLINITALGNIPVATATTNWSDGPLQETLNNDYLNSEGSYTNNGITSATKEKIEKVRWLLGATPEDAGNTITVYQNEKNTNNYWDGSIALIYASDYGYATSGSSTVTRETCLGQALSAWNLQCATNDWLNIKTSAIPRYYVLTPSTLDNRGFNIVNNAVGKTNLTANYGVYISLYLKANVKVTGGLGTYENPYVIK